MRVLKAKASTESSQSKSSETHITRDRLAELFAGLPFARIGQTCKEPRLRIAGSSGEWLIWSSLSELKEAWQISLPPPGPPG